MRRVSQDGCGLTGIAIDEDEYGTLDAVVPLPIDREGDIGFFDIGDDSSVVFGCATLNIAYLIGETKALAINHALAGSTPAGSSGGCHGAVSPRYSAISSCSFITASTVLSF